MPGYCSFRQSGRLRDASGPLFAQPTYSDGVFEMVKGNQREVTPTDPDADPLGELTLAESAPAGASVSGDTVTYDAGDNLPGDIVKVPASWL